jgi:hypothetical protein
MDATGLNRKQLTNWFTNARKRIWQPKFGGLPSSKPSNMAIKIPKKISTSSKPSFASLYEHVSSPTSTATPALQWEELNDPWLPPLSPLRHADIEPEWSADICFLKKANNLLRLCAEEPKSHLVIPNMEPVIDS